MQQTLNWYILYTRPRSEKKVVQLLSRNSVEAYCPFNKVVKEWKGRKKELEEPLFKSFVFVKMENAEQLAEIMVDGIINLVHWRGEPATVSDDEIEMIKRFLYDFSRVSLEKTEVGTDETVRILNAPSIKKGSGTIEIKYEAVKVVLPSLGYVMVAETDRSSAETITVVSDKIVSEKVESNKKVLVSGKEVSSSSTGLQEEEAIN